MNECPYTDDKCNAGNCTKCNVYLEMEYGCEGDCEICKDKDYCDHLGKRENY